MKRIAVAGGGVAGLSTVFHLLEIEERRAHDGNAEPIEILFVSPLIPHEGSEGSGLGGKAMSRSYVGKFDVSHNMDRLPFYGPGMPERGTVPHGYHVMWGYPNVRRMLMRPGEGPDIGGRMRPPGGAGVIAIFQGLIDDPSPGGPGIGLMGLCDPDHPETATRSVTQALFRLRDTAFARPVFALFELLFGAATDGLKLLAFADLLFADEVDLEMRLTLIAASLQARVINPETETVMVDGVAKPLWDVEYTTWVETLMKTRGLEILERIAPGDGRELSALVFARPVVDVIGEISALVRDAVREIGALRRLMSVMTERPAGPEDDHEPGLVADCQAVWGAIHTILDELPAAATRLALGQYPVWRSLHFRFAPDATFASPYSFDAAQAVRSLAFCFLDPKTSRMWSADGAKIQRLWLRLWQNIFAMAARLPHVGLVMHQGRVDCVLDEPDGRVSLVVGGTIGHGHRTAGFDLGYPHQPDLRPPVEPADLQDMGVFDAFVATMPPALLADVIRPLPDRPPSFAPARAQLAPLAPLATISTEILIWTRDAIVYAPAAREGLRNAAITGLEGPFCLLADYRCGLWSDAEMNKEDPFGDGQFTGSLLESCGGYADLWASADREDAFGWPAEAKEAILALLDHPAKYQEIDGRTWPHDDSKVWKARVADGTWTDAQLSDPAAMEDWFVASRWLTWGFLQQLSRCEALGPRAVRQFAYYAGLIDPRGLDRAQLVSPPAELLGEMRWVVMRNANRRNRFFNPGVGDWPKRPVSGVPLAGTTRIFPAGDWTRNGLDVVSMEGACISAMRAARSAWIASTGHALPDHVPAPIPVLPDASWYAGLDPMVRAGPEGE